MTDNKPKYIRKKCEHNKYSYFCKECGGKGICEHNTIRSICKDCGGSQICKHKKIKQQCKECNGKSICDHGKRRSRCIECKGGSVCSHNKLKSRCIECDGNEICSHKIRKSVCIECKGSEICIHNLRKSRCIECNGSEICEHKQNKYCCVNCNSINICIHKKLKYQCIECGGDGVCYHKCRKSICKECNGSYICKHKEQKNRCITCTPEKGCQNCKLIYVPTDSRWNPYCFRCYCILHPDEEIPRKFKLKEHYVRDALKEYYKETITMVFDRKVENGCSKRRPDVCIDFGSHCLMIEIDENRHINYSCEEKRMVELYEDIGFRKIVFIRFNPDGYVLGSQKFISPFKYTKSGILNLNKDEMNRRIQELILKINCFKDKEPLEQLTVEYLFYGY